MESANVVGYANKSLDKGKFKVICTQFQNVGVDAADMTLGDFIPGGTWAASDSMKIFADNATVEMTVRYVNQATADALNNTGKFANTITVGWYATTDTTYSNNLNTKLMPLGTSVMAVSSKTSSYITFAGQVVQTEDDKITFALTKGKFTMIGNCTPTDLTLGDFIPGGTWAASDSMKIFADNATVEMTVRYVNQATADALNKTGKFTNTITVGWYATTDTTYSNNLNGRSVPAGEGFMAVSSKTASTITIPTAL